MGVINPIILDGLKLYCQDHPEIPQDMRKLVEKLLRCETHELKSKEGIDKIYDQVLEQVIDNDSLIEWSKKYVN